MNKLQVCLISDKYYVISRSIGVFFCIFKISFINWLTRPPSQLLLKFATTFFSDLFLERIVAKLADMWEELNSLLKSICMCFWAHAKKIPSDSAKFINLDMPRIYQKQKKNTRGGGGAEPLLARKKTTTVFQLLLLLYFSGVVEYLNIIEKC